MSATGRKVYVGQLGNDVNEEELNSIFQSFGRVLHLFVARKPPGFAFVEYYDARDAADAVRALSGRLICGKEATVQLSHGRSRWPRGRPPHFLLRRPAPRRVNSSEARRENSRLLPFLHLRTHIQDHKKRKR